MSRRKLAPTSREPVETMSRMPLMQELAEWRRVGPALLALARAADRHVAWLNEVTPPEDATATDKAIIRASARLRALSSPRKPNLRGPSTVEGKSTPRSNSLRPAKGEKGTR